MRPRVVTLVAVCAVTLATAALVVLALNWHGFSAQQTSLNDGGVWVDDSRAGLLGRENTPLKQLDVEVQSPTRIGDRLNVLQSGDAVIAVDEDASEVTPVDPVLAQANPHDAVQVADPDVQLGGGVTAVTQPASGRIWAAQVDPAGGIESLGGLSAAAKPLTSVGAGAVLAVSDTGTILAVSSQHGDLTAISPKAGGGFSRPLTRKLQPAPRGTVSQLTAVGPVAVWLDSSGRVGFRGHEVSVGAGAVLQQAGPAAGVVLVATPTRLFSINLRTARVTALVSVAAATPSAPVQLDGCAWGLWSGQLDGVVSAKCAGARVRTDPPFTVPADGQLVFRVNRNAIFVNDLVSGDVWSVGGAQVQSVGDWSALEPQQQQSQRNKAQKVIHPTVQPAPVAVTDHLGGRSGDTTVLHVLDNDRAPAGAILSISSVQNSNRSLTVQISRDRQTLLAQVNQGVANTTLVFHYTIDDGERTNSTATGEVDFTVQPDYANHAQPQLRFGYSPGSEPVYPVAAGGSVDLPVLANWRDPVDGDPIELVPGSAHVADGSVSITPEGTLRYLAPDRFSGVVTLGYAVTTGGAESSGRVRVRVYDGLATAAPTAEPNVVSAVAGSPVTVTPLANAIPGADPIDPQAQTTLAADVAPQPGLNVQTDLGVGTVTLRAQRPGIYVLPYRLAYGSAAGTSTSDIKLVVAPPSDTSNLPVATPVTTAVYGSAPQTVDVLASDYDPRDRLLAVTDASPQSANGQLDVAVIDGHWIRVSSRSGTLVPSTQVIDYTISNGYAEASSTLTVTQLPSLPSAADGPDAEPVQAVVRAGQSVEIPVLANDSTPSGDPVGLVVPQTSKPGALPLSSGAGTAYIDGDDVRFVAPAGITEPATATFVYAVQNTSDPQAPDASALVTVRIIPAPSSTRPDQAPTPPELDARVVEGGTVTLQVPSTGSDPQGDQLSVTGIGDPSLPDSEPHLGQVISYGADTITYQAFADQTGEDQFVYQVTDPYGQIAEGTVRVAVVPAGGIQAPVAVDQTVTVDPKNTLRVNVLAQALTPAGTTPALEPLRDAPAGVSAHNGVITVTPGSYGSQLVIPYTITNGLQESSANLIVNFQPGYVNPPLAGDVVAHTQPGKDTVVAHVLDHVSDIDEPESDLRVVMVNGAPTQDIHGGTVTLPVSEYPRVWTYAVQNAAGAQAVGSIYVSGSVTEVPYLKPGSVLHLSVNATDTVNLSDYVITPDRGTQPYLTLAKQITGEPGDAFAAPVSAASQQALTVHAGRQAGTAELIFQVSDQRNLSAKNAHTAVITLPVVIGDPPPVLSCPADPIYVPQSGSQTVDVGAICHVWQNPYDQQRLSYSGSLEAGLAGVTVTSDGTFLHITADNAPAGGHGTVAVHVDGYSSSSTLDLVTTPLPPPSMRPIPALQAHAGKSVSVNLAPYLSNDSLPPQDFDPAVIRVTPLNGGPAAALAGTMATFTPPTGEHLTYSYQVVMSDSGPHSNRPTATAQVQVVVTDVPSEVTGVVTGSQVLSDQVQLQWTAPDDGGLPITKYVVSDQAGETTCFATTCTVSGLQNGTTYDFRVTAYNQLGPSRRPSAPVAATPDAVPGPVTDLQVTAESDGQVVYQWDRPTGDFSPVTEYLVSGGSNSGYQTVSSTAAVVTDTVQAANGSPVSFSVSAVDHLGVDKPGPAVSDGSAVASGQPAPPSGLSVSGTNVAGGTTKAFAIAWDQVDPNGRGDTYYEILQDGTPATCLGESEWFTATSCTVDVPNSGASYSYQVVAANAAGVPGQNEPIEGAPATHQSPPSATSTVIAAGEPTSITPTLTATGQSGGATLSFEAGATNGGAGTVTCVDSSITCSFTVPASGGSQSEALTGLTDGQSYSVTLQYCNNANGNRENTALGISPCITSNPVTVAPYGPIQDATVSASVSGLSSTVSSSVDANGGNVDMTITSSDGASHSCSGGPSGTVTCDWSESSLNYSTTYSYTLSVTDASGHNRNSQTAHSSGGTTEQPPAPTIQLSDSAIDTYHFSVSYTLGNFEGSPTCTGSFYTAPGGSSLGGGQWSQGDQYTFAPDVTSPFYVTMSCTGDDLSGASRTVSSSFTIPAYSGPPAAVTVTSQDIIDRPGDQGTYNLVSNTSYFSSAASCVATYYTQQGGTFLGQSTFSQGGSSSYVFATISPTIYVTETCTGTDDGGKAASVSTTYYLPPNS